MLAGSGAFEVVPSFTLEPLDGVGAQRQASRHVRGANRHDRSRFLVTWLMWRLYRVRIGFLALYVFAFIVFRIVTERRIKVQWK
jgi:hypothetical protein